MAEIAGQDRKDLYLQRKVHRGVLVDPAEVPNIQGHDRTDLYLSDEVVKVILDGDINLGGGGGTTSTTSTPTAPIVVDDKMVILPYPAAANVTTRATEGYFVLHTTMKNINQFVTMKLGGYNLSTGKSFGAAQVAFYASTGTVPFQKAEVTFTGGWILDITVAADAEGYIVLICKTSGNSLNYSKLWVEEATISDVVIPVEYHTGWQMVHETSITTYKNRTSVDQVHSLSDKANLSSPVFTGIPQAPTAGTSSNSTQIATTEFVHDLVDPLSTLIAPSTTLATKAKTLTGAINEVFQAGNNVKSGVVGALLQVDSSLPITPTSAWDDIVAQMAYIETGGEIVPVGPGYPIWIPDFTPGKSAFCVIDRGPFYQDETMKGNLFAIVLKTAPVGAPAFYWMSAEESDANFGTAYGAGTVRGLIADGRSGYTAYANYSTEGFVNGVSGTTFHALGLSALAALGRDGNVDGVLFSTHDIVDISGNVLRKKDQLLGQFIDAAGNVVDVESSPTISWGLAREGIPEVLNVIVSGVSNFTSDKMEAFTTMVDVLKTKLPDFRYIAHVVFANAYHYVMATDAEELTIEGGIISSKGTIWSTYSSGAKLVSAKADNPINWSSYGNAVVKVDAKLEITPSPVGYPLSPRAVIEHVSMDSLPTVTESYSIQFT